MNKLAHKIILFFFFIIIQTSGFGQSLHNLGQTPIHAVNNPTFTNNHNPAVLGDLNTHAISISGTNLYSIPKLFFMEAQGIFHTNSGSISLGLQQLQHKTYFDRNVQLGYGRKIFNNLNIGAQFNFLQKGIDGYGQNNLMTFGLGFSSELNSKLLVGARIISPVQVSFSTHDQLGNIMMFGFNFTPNSKLTFLGEIEKESSFGFNFKTVIKYQPVKYISIDIGTETLSLQYILNVSYFYKDNFILQFGSKYHLTFGFSPNFSIVYLK